MSKKYIINSFLLFYATLLLIGCGGKGGAFGDKNPKITKYQIQAIDGYIKNATIKDGNGSVAKYDSTLRNGTYYFTSKPTGTITLSGGSIESSGIDFEIELNCDYESSKIISPITTFIQGNYVLKNKYKSLLGIDDLDINYITKNNKNLAKLSQLFYLLIKEKSLGATHKTYIQNNTPASIDEVFSAIQSDINSSTLSNKTSLALYVDRISSFDDNVTNFENFIKDYKLNIGNSSSAVPVFQTNIDKIQDFDDGHYHKGADHNFTRDSSTEIVKDTTLNLEWEDITNTFQYNQYEAKTHCEMLDLNGTNWRVPTIAELQTLRDCNNTTPSINPIFVNTNNNRYVSNSREAQSTINANFWTLDFDTGRESLNDYYTKAYLRCVRGDTYNNYALMLDINHTRRDTAHNLMWQDSNENISLIKTYNNSISYCENLDYASYDDWRLPNINELNSIYDKSKVDVSFTNISTNSYWSSSSYKSNTTMAWVIFRNKAVNVDAKNELNSVRCVRDN